MGIIFHFSFYKIACFWKREDEEYRSKAERYVYIVCVCVCGNGCTDKGT